MSKEKDLLRAIEGGKRVAARCNPDIPSEKHLRDLELENVANNEKRLKEFLEKKK